MISQMYACNVTVHVTFTWTCKSIQSIKSRPNMPSLSIVGKDLDTAYLPSNWVKTLYTVVKMSFLHQLI